MKIDAHNTGLVALVVHINAIRAISHFHGAHEHAVTVFLILKLEAGSGVEENIIFTHVFDTDVNAGLSQKRMFIEIIYALFC